MRAASRSRVIGSQVGVGLIEVLISLLVLSFGMLGLAGLQMWSLKNNQSSMERSLAVVESHTIIDAMRADRDTALAGGFNDGASVTSDFATNALASWRASLLNTLGPGASGTVNCTADGDCTITVTWDDQRASEAGTTAEGEALANPTITTQVRL